MSRSSTAGRVGEETAIAVVLRCMAVGAAALLLQGAVLLAMGQPAICACGTVKVWHGVVQSAENSQHLTDWYTFSHVIHGFGFYLLVWLFAPNRSLTARFAMALSLEVGWEIVENTPMIVERYRQTAMAQGYFGDSVVNSLADTVAMAAGFVLARLAPIPVVVTLAVVMELSVGYAIRDNLILNIIQLIYPIAAVSRWQMGQ